MNKIKSVKFSANEMNSLVLKGRQKPLHFKRRKYSREELQLVLYRQTYEMMKNYKQVYINSALRKIRLTNLKDFVKTERNKTNKNRVKSIRSNLKMKTNTDLIREQWLEARSIGNEFSKMNKYNNFEPLRWEKYKKKDMKKIKEKTMKKAKDYGNICSLLNITKVSIPSKNSRITTHREKLLEKRHNIMEYGSYYSMRNKLYLKDSLGEFDNEYQNLLEKCVTFERNHLNVCGFLEEMLYNSLSSQQKKIADMRKKCKRRNAYAKKESKISKSYEKGATKEKLHATVAVQANINIENIDPCKKKFSLEPKTSKSLPDIHLRDCPDKVINIENDDYDSCLPSYDKINVNTEKDENIEKDDNTSKTNELFENFLTLSETVTIGQSFEEAVLDLTECLSEGTQSSKMKQVISNLFLAFGLNLVKSAVGQDTIMKDIETNNANDKVTEQPNPLLVSVL